MVKPYQLQAYKIASYLYSRVLAERSRALIAWNHGDKGVN